MAPNQQFAVSVDNPNDQGRTLVFTFIPNVPSGEHGANGRRKPSEFIVQARQEPTPVLEWVETSDDPGAAKAEIEEEVRTRLNEKTIWIDRVTALVGQVERWAREMNWATRRVDKKLEDIRIGTHRVPALLLQEDTCKILLEPVARSAPGAEGLADLYLMPGYDDIANLYYYDDRWNLHYTFPRADSVASVHEAAVLSLTKETLQKVLAEMRQNAA